MIISVPSKTFLLGEYAVLDQAPSILVNTTPRFVVSIGTQDSLQKKAEDAFHKDSPSYAWIKENHELFSDARISIEDPYQNQGGFGLSSAEFNCVYLYSLVKQNKNWYDADLQQIWNRYRHVQKNNAVLPSGADVISQWVGGVCLFSPEPFNVQSVTWPFADLDFALIKTGQKLSTWEHLKHIEGVSFEDLKSCVYEAFKMIQTESAEAFVDVVNRYAQILEKMDLITPESRSILEKLRKNSSILAAKGCGALGAEVIVVFFKTKDEDEIQNLLQDYNIIGRSNTLTQGIDVLEEDEK